MRHYTNSRKIYAFGSLILGILLLLWPVGALKLVSYAVGIIIMAGGITSILSRLRSRKRGGGAVWTIFIGAVITLVGGWIFVNPENFASIIPSAIGYLITLSGIINLLETFTLSKAHYRKWWVSLLAAVLTIMLGLVLINHAFGIAATMVRIGGAALLFTGVSDLWINRRVEQYANTKRRSSRASGGAGSAKAGGGGTARHDTSDPDIIDAEDYREL
jgi:uncharacterized membrane protein HdeD (DUF308 family)